MTAGVEANYPVPHDLRTYPADPSRRTAAAAIVNLSQCQSRRAWFALFGVRATLLNAVPSKSSRKPIADPMAKPSNRRTPLIRNFVRLGIPRVSHPQRRLVSAYGRMINFSRTSSKSGISIRRTTIPGIGTGREDGMSKNAATSRLKPVEKVNYLVAAAADEFAARGKAAAKMSNIAGNAKMSRRAVYKRYPNKSALYREACHYIDNFHFDSLLDIDYTFLPPSEAMGEFFRTLLRSHRLYPSISSMFAEQLLKESRDFSRDDQAAAKIKKIKEQLSDLLSRGRATGDFASDWNGELLYFISAIMIEKAVVESSTARRTKSGMPGEPSVDLEERVIRALLRATRHQASTTSSGDRAKHSTFIPQLDRTPNSVTSILNAAEWVFGTVGFAGGTISEIADTADVSSQLVYHYFQSKTQLYSGVLERLGRNGFSIHDTIDLRQDAMKVIEDFIGRIWEYYFSYPLSARLCLDYGLNNKPILFAKGVNRRKRQHLHDGINSAIQRGIAQGQIHPEVDASLLIMIAKSLFVPAAILEDELDGVGMRPFSTRPVASPTQQLRLFVLSAITTPGQQDER